MAVDVKRTWDLRAIEDKHRQAPGATSMWVVASQLLHAYVAADHLLKRFIGERAVLVGFLNLFGLGNRLISFRGVLAHFGPPLGASWRTKLGPVVRAFLVVVGGDGGPDAREDEGHCGDQEPDGRPDTLEEHRYNPGVTVRKIVMAGATHGERRHTVVDFS
jgi:hypothetical protein